MTTRPCPEPGARRGCPAVVVRRGAWLAAAWLAATGLLLVCGRAVVASPAVTGLDRGITTWVVDHRSSALDAAMTALTWTGSWLAAAGLVLVLAALAALRRLPVLAVATVLVGWLGALAAVSLVKAVVRRPRPPDAVRLVQTHGWAFPSGHTANAVVVFSTAAVLACLVLRSARARWAVRAVAAAAVLLIAFSRVELGAHWATDVAASVVWTTAWLVPVVTVLPGLPVRRGPGRAADSPSGAAEPTTTSGPVQSPSTS